MSEQALEDILANAQAELEQAITAKDQQAIYDLEAHIDDLENEIAMMGEPA